MISIHAPPRRATKNHMAGLAERADFNSRPSARGDDFRRARCGVFRLISIHAPPRGATDGQAVTDVGRNISIHAPPRGATGSWRLLGLLESHFNSRPSARGDRRRSRRKRGSYGFRFTPLREGATYDGERVRFAAWRYFNSRPSARGDPPNDQGVGSANYFNSRPSARGDGRFADGLLLCTKFQFTPLREGRQCSISRRFPDFLFQFTPLREGRHLVKGIALCAMLISIHAPPRGATSMQYNMSIRKIISIHAPPRGATARCR